MKRIVFLTVLLVFSVLVPPVYSGKPTPQPNQVEVVNGPENPVPVMMTNPPPTGDAAIKGMDRQESEIVKPVPGVNYNLVSLAGPGTFIGAQAKASGNSVEQILVKLKIDGKMIVDVHRQELGAGYDQMNQMGLVVHRPTKQGFS